MHSSLNKTTPNTQHPMNEIQIRAVAPDEAEILQKIGKETFTDTFTPHNSEANMRDYLDTSFTIPKLTGELGQPHSRFYFAMDGNEVVGYLKVNFAAAQTELRTEDSLEIERIYVLKAYQGRKVGQLLYEQAIAVAKAHNLDYIWLGVWEKNERALGFYTKNGFAPFGQHVFRLGDDEQTDVMMKKQIKYA